MASSSSDKTRKPLIPPCYRSRLVGAGLLVLLATVLVLIPVGAARWLESWLLEQGATSAEILNIDFNPFTGEVVIEGLDASSQDGGRLFLERGSLEIDWWPLFQRRISLHDLALKNSHVDIRITEEGVPVIGPLRFPAEEQAPEESAEPFGFGVSGITLEGIEVSYRDSQIERDIRIDRFNTAALADWEPDQQSRFELALAVGEGGFHIEGITRPFGGAPYVEAELKVHDLPLGWLGPLFDEQGISSFDGILQTDATLRFVAHGDEAPGIEVNFDGELALEGLQGRTAEFELHRGAVRYQGTVDWRSDPAGDEPVLVAEGETAIDGVEMRLSAADLDLRQEQLVATWQVVLPGGEDAAVQLQLDLDARGSRIDDLKKGLNLLQLERLVGEAIRLDGTAQLSTEAIRANGLDLLQRPHRDNDGAQSHILSIAGLRVDRVRLVGLQRLTIAAIHADAARAQLVRTAAGTLDLQSWRGGEPEEGDAAAEAAVTDEEGKGGDLSVAIGEFEIGGDSRFAFIDRKVAPAFDYRLEKLHLRLGELDQAVPERPSPVRFEAKRGKYGSLALEGTATPLAERLSLDLSGKIKSLELPQLDPYARQFIGYRVVSGNLDADFGVKVNKGKLDAVADAVLIRLDVEAAAQQGTTEEVNNSIGIPLETALSLMRDKDDTITLDLAVEGDLDNPQFNVGELVVSVLAKAVKKGVVAYYAPMGLSMLTGAAVPLGVTYVAGKLFKLVTTMRFEPVVFAPQSAELDDVNRKRLIEIAKRLKDRPKVRLILCGKATEAEAVPEPVAETAAETEAVTPKVAEEGEGAKSLSKEQIENLRQLAEERSNRVKDLLAEQGIAAERLLICGPQVESEEESLPRVEIGI